MTSPATLQDVVEHFAVPRQAITSILPGTDRVSRVSRPSVPGPLQLLSVGSVVKRKGFDILLPALAKLTELPWHLTIAGDLTRDAEAVAQLQADLERFDLLNRVRVLGAIDSAHLQVLYSQADVFVLASRFEGYGMAAHGLPVIGTTAGAIPDTVPDTAGLLAKPGDVDSLQNALRQIIQDQVLRQSLSQGALLAAAQQPSWAECARSFEEVVERSCAVATLNDSDALR